MQMPNAISCACAAILLSLFAATTSSAQTNLLTNPEFEAGKEGWTFKSGAQLAGDANNHWLVASSAYARAEQEVKLKAEWKKLKVTTRMRLNSVQRGNKRYETARVAITWLNAQGKPYKYPSSVISGTGSTDGWQRYEQVYEIPQDADAVRVGPAMLGKRGQAEFDELTLTVVGDDAQASGPTITEKAEKKTPLAPAKLQLGPDYQLVWHDEFNGPAGIDTFDHTQWHHKYFDWRHNGYQNKDSVKLNGKGNLVITNYVKEMETEHKKQDGKFRFFTGMICTADTFSSAYGYWEARVKMQEVSGSWSAFWNIGPHQVKNQYIGNPGKTGTEIDIMEYIEDIDGPRHNQIMHAVHWDGYGKNHKTDKYRGKLEGLSEGYHIFGMQWTPSGYTFYLDGQRTWEFDGAVSHVPHYAILSTEIMFDSWAGDIRKHRDKLPDDFTVDYVRVWQTPKQWLTRPLPIVDTFDVGDQPTFANDEQDKADIGWLPRGSQLEVVSSDHHLGSGKALQVAFDKWGQVVSEPFAQPYQLKHKGDQLRFGFDVKLAEPLPNANGKKALKLGIFDAKSTPITGKGSLWDKDMLDDHGIAVQVGITQPQLMLWEDKTSPCAFKPDHDGKHIIGKTDMQLLDGSTHRLELQLTCGDADQLQAQVIIDGKAVKDTLIIGNADTLTFSNVRIGADDLQPVVLLDNMAIRYIPASIPGDFNADGQMTRIDREAMQQALDDVDAYHKAYPDVNLQVAGDLNNDGKFDSQDVTVFEKLLAQQ